MLLYLRASWSAACRDLDTRVFEAADVTEGVAARAIAVRVDVDSRPDIADRYGLGGWPSVLLLTPSGEALTGGQRIEPQQLVQVLHRIGSTGVHLSGPSGASDQASRPPGLTEPGSAPRGAADELCSDFLGAAEAALADPFGTGQCWVGHAPAVDALLTLFERRHLARAGRLAGQWLDIAMVAGLQHASGAMLRPGEDMSLNGPEPVALLEQNAWFLAVLARAGRVLDRGDFNARAEALNRFLVETLRHRAGGFVHAWAPASSTWGDEHAGRHGGNGRVLDARRFVTGNALAITACIGALEFPGSLDGAAVISDALDAVLSTAFTPGGGVAHSVDEPQPRRFLTDQLHAASASLAAFGGSHQAVYLDLAEELLLGAFRDFSNSTHGLLQDKEVGAKDGIGRLQVPLVSLAQNAAAIRLLVQLGAHRAQTANLERARAMLDRCWGLVAPDDPELAHFVLAAQDVVELDA